MEGRGVMWMNGEARTVSFQQRGRHEFWVVSLSDRLASSYRQEFIGLVVIALPPNKRGDRGAREGWKAMARCNWYRWNGRRGGEEEIWFNVPMMLLSGADNRHGWHKGTVVKFQLTKSDPENRTGSSSCNRGSSFSFLLFFSTRTSLYLFIYLFREGDENYSTLVIQKKRKTWKIQENRIRKIFINSLPVW